MARNQKKGQTAAKANDTDPFKTYEPRRSAKRQGRTATNGRAAGSVSVEPPSRPKEQTVLFDEEYNNVSPQTLANDHGLQPDFNFNGAVAEASSGYDASDDSVLGIGANQSQFSASIDPHMVRTLSMADMSASKYYICRCSVLILLWKCNATEANSYLHLMDPCR